MNGISFRSDFGCWWPDYDHKPEKCHALVVRNSADVKFTAKLCHKRRLVVQAGGHAGIWPIALAGLFDQVLTFEPDPHLHACLLLNTAPFPNIAATGLPTALGDAVGTTLYSPRCSAGSGRTGEPGGVPVPVVTIDSLELAACDAIILDVEGYEPKILEGARETIAKFRPVLHVEALPRADEQIRAFMGSAGYALHRQVHMDLVFLPK